MDAARSAGARRRAHRLHHRRRHRAARQRKRRTLWEATSLQRGEQDVALFGVPPGYQLIDPQAVAEQVGENMQQLDSVTGAPPTQQPAPSPRG
jgi:hypothetical protein